MQKLSEYFAPTHREDPAEAELISHKLLLRAGFIRPVGAGLYSLMPLGLRVIRKIECILRAEMNRVGGQEVLLPVTQPAELWKESGRWDGVGAEMLRFKDRGARDMCLAMTHEESVVALVRNDIKSWRQLPLMLYQLQTKFRDEPRARGGLIRAREFTMKDAYSFHEDEADLDRYYPRLHEAYTRIFERCGLDFAAVESDPGMMGGATAHEFIAFADSGEDTILSCKACGYSANRQIAHFRRDAAETEEMLPIEEIATPDKTSIEDVAEFLRIPKSKTAKAVFFHGSKRGLIFAILRGDYEINETLLMNAIGETDLRPAHPDEIAASGAVAGYASPINVKAVIVADVSIERARNLVAGANRDGFHLRNVNVGRDFTPHIISRIAGAEEGLPCFDCGEPLAARRGIEVGNIFKLGTRYSASMNAVFQNRTGQEKPYVMGCYGIGSGRLMASVAEQSHDDDGIIWPCSIAPFECAVIVASDKRPEAVNEIELALRDACFDALIDDRDLRAGVKFKDADLIGCPIRITIGRKIESGIVELKNRKTGEVSEHALDGLAEALRKF